MSVYPRKNGIYHYDFKISGVRFYGTTGCTSRREAEKFEGAKREEAEALARTATEQRNAPMTVNVAFDKFWLEVGSHYKGSYGQTFLGALAWLTNELGANTLIRDISSNRIIEAIARRRGEQHPREPDRKLSPATVNRTVTEPLRRIIKRARDLWGQEVQTIQWGKLLLEEPKERVRELRDHEERDLVPAMRDDYRPILAFFLVSGCRLKEVVNLKWQDIDWTAKTVTVAGKGDKIVPIPLTGDMQAILAPLRGHHQEAVFTYVTQRPTIAASGKTIPRGARVPITYEGMKTTWRRYGGASAGLKDFRLHDLRHTAATRLLREVGNLKLVQQLLRHEDIATTAKYAHTDLADLREAMERVEKSRRASRIVENETEEKAGKSEG
jgi:integrase